MGDEELEELRKIRKANERMANAAEKMERRDKPIRKFARDGFKKAWKGMNKK